MAANAEIITIGDEILYGQTLDTNSHWMSEALTAAGIHVASKKTIGDQNSAILKALEESESHHDIVLITGGLGPTNDDLTKPCLVEYFNTSLVRNEEMLLHISTLFEKAGRELTELNVQQADLPKNAEAIKNELGTAPGMWFERNGKTIVSMPGVPYEMKRMMEGYVIPRLKEKYVKDVIYHKIIRTVGVPESKLAKMIATWEKDLPNDLKLAYLPTLGTVKLRLTSRNKDPEAAAEKTEKYVKKLIPIIDQYVYGYDNEELEEAVGRMLRERKLKLAIAESCTGGYLSHKITSVAGCSEWYSGGLVPYSNHLKIEQLNVDSSVIAKYGAVSEQVVIALANNVRKAFGADVAVSISGIAGPTGGTTEKPVGTVWIGYSDKVKTIAKKFQFTKDRSLNIQFAAIAALNMIRLNI